MKKKIEYLVLKVGWKKLYFNSSWIQGDNKQPGTNNNYTQRKLEWESKTALSLAGNGRKRSAAGYMLCLCIDA